MAVQILGLREYIHPKTGKPTKKETFFEAGWRALSVSDLFANIETLLDKIPEDEKWNIYYTAADCREARGRHLVKQDIVPIDIDDIDVNDLEPYIAVVENVTEVPRDKMGVVFSGNGLQFIIQLKEPITDPDYFDEHRGIYKAMAGRINQQMYLNGLVGNVDPSVFSKGRLLRLPFTTNRKPNKPEREAKLLYGKIEYAGFDLWKASKIPYVMEGDHIHPRAVAKMPEPDPVGVLEGCDFLKFVKSNQETISEPQWYAMLSIVGRLPDGGKLVHEFSKNHPDYHPDETDMKLEHALESAGPRTCENINSLWDGCKDCANWNNCKSPIMLRTEEFIATKETGFYEVTIDRNGQVKNRKPCYDDLVKWYVEKNEYCTMNSSSIVHNFDGKKWVDVTVNDIHNFAETWFDPKPTTTLCKEFEAKLKRTHLQEPDWFNVDGYINFDNGVLDLETMTLGEHSSSFGFRYVLPFNYDPDATCPRFDQFIEEITLKDKQLGDVLLEFMGYSLVGADPSIGQKALILHGEGSNGKSVFIEVLRSLAGKNNYSTLSMGSEINKLENRYQLASKLFNISEETPTKAMMDSSIFKALVAGGEVQARKLYCDSYSMKNYAKIIMACNELPRTTDLSHGMMRRLLIIPFQATFTEETKDVLLINTLKGELAGIFNRAMEGYKRFLDNNKRFTESVAVTASVQRYQNDNDSIAAWMEDETVISAATVTPFKEAYFNYKNYCDSMGLYCESSMLFSRRVSKVLGEECKVRVYEDGRQTRGIKGLKLAQGF